MMVKRLAGEAIALAFTLGACFAITQHGTSELRRKQKQAMIHRFEQAVAIMIGKAHEAKDDLQIQQIVQSLGQASDVAMACVVDSDKKILAHSQPAQLGQTFSAFGIPKPLYSVELKNGNGNWGRLILSLTDRPSQTAEIKLRTFIGICFVLSGTVLFGLRALDLQRMAHAEKRVADMVWLQQEEREARARAEKAGREQENRLEAWIQNLVDQVHQPLVLLDHQQRGLAANAAARERLGIDPLSLSGVSWQEIPCLAGGGALLGESLRKPNQIMIGNHDPKLQLCSVKTPSNGLMGTWIVLS
ncbi:MAG TPA: hypothetical protein VMU17_05995 [Elusimicrobiota bacterium]|nr:hypothetical protein [Elusimicrobiota bacterium]